VGWAGGARRLRQFNLAEKGDGSVVSRSVCLANGSITFVRTRRFPVVSSLAVAISNVGFDAADHLLDCEHFSHLRPMAFERR
jgi:hypothetical protein